MISDRSYMRSDYEHEKLRALPWMFGSLVAALLLELIMFSPWFHATGDILRHIVLDPQSLRDGRFWTLLTYPLFSNALSGNIFFAVFALAALFFMGRALEPLLGPRRLVGLFGGALLIGGLTWMAVNWRHHGVLFGYTPGLCGLLMFYACVYPDEPFRFLAFFFLPVTIRPRKLVLALFLLDAFALVFFEVAGGAMPLAFAPSAHLGGMAVGWLCHRLWRGNEQTMGWRQPVTELLRLPRPTFSLPGWLRRRRDPIAPARSSASPAAPTAVTLRAEVDRILDKINAHGFGALTSAEKRTLDEAKNLAVRR
jgi:membrane associated rhomboid family serine protease